MQRLASFQMMDKLLGNAVPVFWKGFAFIDSTGIFAFSFCVDQEFSSIHHQGSLLPVDDGAGGHTGMKGGPGALQDGHCILKKENQLPYNPTVLKLFDNPSVTGPQIGQPVLKPYKGGSFPAPPS